MKKIEIVNCLNCPNKKNTSNIRGAFCELAKDFLGEDLSTFPEWCPLTEDKQTCRRCGYEFFPSPDRDAKDKRKIVGIRLPKTCPSKDCKSPYWMKMRKTEGSDNVPNR